MIFCPRKQYLETNPLHADRYSENTHKHRMTSFGMNVDVVHDTMDVLRHLQDAFYSRPESLGTGGNMDRMRATECEDPI